MDANFKEDQLTHMVDGDAATVAADVLPGHAFHAAMSPAWHLAPARCSASFPLKTRRATSPRSCSACRSAWMLDPGDAAALRMLRPGLSTVASVDTRAEQRAGAVITTAPRHPSILPFVVMCVGMFVALLDIQIVASSLQDIGGELSAAQDQISWVQTAYLIAEIVMIPLSGWLTRVFSTRWLFTISAAGFTATNMLCGLAWNIESMIVFRSAAGALPARR